MLRGRAALALIAGMALPAAAQPTGEASTGAPPAAAGEPAPLPVSPDDTWTIRFEPSLWYFAAGGDLTMPGSGGGGSDRTDIGEFNLDSPRLTPAGELTFNTDRWRLAVSGYDFSTEDRGAIASEDFRVGGLDIQSGDPIVSDLQFASWDFTARYEVVEFPTAPVSEGRWPFLMSVEGVGGVTFYDVGFDLAGPAGSTSADEFFAEPMAGIRIVLDVAEQVTIDVQSTVGAWTDGGDRESFTYDIAVGFMYRPVENVGIQVGYRQQAFSLSSGEGSELFEFDGSMAGVFAGVVVRF